MYEDGITFSYLNPFSTAYYRKFGYEMACMRNQYHIRFNALSTYSVDGACTLVEPSHFMLNEIKEIYKIWQDKYNMMIVNEDFEYAWVTKSNPVKDQVFTYVYVSSDSSPKGYMSLKQVPESDGRNLVCTRFCFTDVEGLKGLLNLAISLGSDHDYVTFETPTDMDITLIIPEWSMNAGTCKQLPCGMVRAIHVEKILGGAIYEGSGSLTIQIYDNQIAANITADVSMDINAFSRLIIGSCDVSSIEFMDNVTIHSNIDMFKKVFYKKPNLILEYF